MTLVGDDGAGKSSLLHRFLYDKWDPNLSSDNYGKMKSIIIPKYEKFSTTLRLYVTSGDPNAPQTEAYCRTADCALIVCDSTYYQQRLMENVINHIETVLKYKDVPKLPILIVATKCDLNEELQFQHIYEKIKAKFRTNDILKMMDVSAKSNKNVLKAFMDLVTKTMELKTEIDDETFEELLDEIHEEGQCPKWAMSKSQIITFFRQMATAKQYKDDKGKIVTKEDVIDFKNAEDWMTTNKNFMEEWVQDFNKMLSVFFNQFSNKSYEFYKDVQSSIRDDWEQFEQAMIENNMDYVSKILIPLSRYGLCVEDIDKCPAWLLNICAAKGYYNTGVLLLELFPPRTKVLDIEKCLQIARDNGNYAIASLLSLKKIGAALGEQAKLSASHIDRINGITNYALSQMTDECIEANMKFMIKCIECRGAFSDDMLNICLKYIVRKHGQEELLNCDLFKAIIKEFETIISDTSNKIGFEWLNSFLIPSSIWFWQHPQQRKSETVKTFDEKEENCPGYHGLKQFNNTFFGCSCNICKMPMAKNSKMYGCRTCNYDVCCDCFGEESSENGNVLLFEELLIRVQKETEIQATKWLKQHIENMKQNSLWKNLTEYGDDINMKEIECRQDLLENGLKSKYSKNELISKQKQGSLDIVSHYNCNIFMNQLLMNAHNIDPLFQNEMRKIVKVISKESYIDKVSFKSGPIKKLQRSLAKVQTDYYNEEFPSSARLLDINRCSLYFGDIQSLYHFVNEFKKYVIENKRSEIVVNIVRIKNGFKDCDNYCYRDIKANVVIFNNLQKYSMIAEVQFLVAFMSAFKINVSHSLYSIERREDFMKNFALLKNEFLNEKIKLFTNVSYGNHKDVVKYIVCHNKTDENNLNQYLYQSDEFENNIFKLAILKNQSHLLKKILNLIQNKDKIQDLLDGKFLCDVIKQNRFDECLKICFNEMPYLLSKIYGCSVGWHYLNHGNLEKHIDTLYKIMNKINHNNEQWFDILIAKRNEDCWSMFDRICIIFADNNETREIYKFISKLSTKQINDLCISSQGLKYAITKNNFKGNSTEFMQYLKSLYDQLDDEKNESKEQQNDKENDIESKEKEADDENIFSNIFIKWQITHFEKQLCQHEKISIPGPFSLYIEKGEKYDTVSTNFNNKFVISSCDDHFGDLEWSHISFYDWYVEKYPKFKESFLSGQWSNDEAKVWFDENILPLFPENENDTNNYKGEEVEMYKSAYSSKFTMDPVVPRKMSAKTEYFQARDIYIVDISIIRAINLAKPDKLNGNTNGLVKVQCLNRTFRTVTIKNDLNPTWNAKTQFYFFRQPMQIKFRVLNWNSPPQKDKPLGNITLNINDEYWLQGKTGFSKQIVDLTQCKRGQIEIAFSCTKLEAVEKKKQYKQEMDTIFRQYNQLKQDCAAYEQQCNQLEQECAQEKEQKANCEEQGRKYDREIQNLQEECVTAENRFNKLNKDVNDKNYECDEIIKQYSNIEIECDKLQNVLGQLQQQENKEEQQGTKTYESKEPITQQLSQEADAIVTGNDAGSSDQLLDNNNTNKVHDDGKVNEKQRQKKECKKQRHDKTLMNSYENCGYDNNSDHMISLIAFGGFAAYYTKPSSQKSELDKKVDDETKIGLGNPPHDLYFVNDISFLSRYEVRDGYEKYGAIAYFNRDYQLISIYLCHSDKSYDANSSKTEWKHAKWSWKVSVTVAIFLYEYVAKIRYWKSSGLVAAIQESMNLNHPIRRLLFPFCFGTMYADNVLNAYLKENGLYHRCFSFKYNSLCQLLTDAMQNPKFRLLSKIVSAMKKLPAAIFPLHEDVWRHWVPLITLMEAYIDGFHGDKDSFENDKDLLKFYNAMCDKLKINSKKYKFKKFNFVHLCADFVGNVTFWQTYMNSSVSFKYSTDLDFTGLKIETNNSYQNSRMSYLEYCSVVLSKGCNKSDILEMTNIWKQFVPHGYEGIIDQYRRGLLNISREISTRKCRIPFKIMDPKLMSSSLKL